MHRTEFDDEAEANRLRRERRIVKVRLQGGVPRYVRAEDLRLYANTFRREAKRLTDPQRAVYDALQRGSPLTPRQLKEETGLLNKQVMPALHRLQEAFLVYEDQVDDDWERGWYELAQEWPEVELAAERRDPARAEVLSRFLHAHVFATLEQLHDWSRLPARDLKRLCAGIEDDGRWRPAEVDGLGVGWTLAQAPAPPSATPPRGVFMLHKADPLVRSHASELERRFGSRDLLQFLLVDGAFQGVVRGHWRFAPYDVEDVSLELSRTESELRRDEILSAVVEGYPPSRHRVLRYAGRVV